MHEHCMQDSITIRYHRLTKKRKKEEKWKKEKEAVLFVSFVRFLRFSHAARSTLRLHVTSSSVHVWARVCVDGCVSKAARAVSARVCCSHHDDWTELHVRFPMLACRLWWFCCHRLGPLRVSANHMCISSSHACVLRDRSTIGWWFNTFMRVCYACVCVGVHASCRPLRSSVSIDFCPSVSLLCP